MPKLMGPFRSNVSQIEPCVARTPFAHEARRLSCGRVDGVEAVQRCVDVRKGRKSRRVTDVVIVEEGAPLDPGCGSGPRGLEGLDGQEAEREDQPHCGSSE